MTRSEKTINRKNCLAVFHGTAFFCLHIPETNTLRQTVRDAMQRFQKLQYALDKHPPNIIHYAHCEIAV